jgi:2-oxoglutarate ferredoxin oxidoreductase subunit delta
METVKKTNPKGPPKGGKIVIDRERCKGCQLCIVTCPQKAICLSEEFNEKGVHFVSFNDGKRCTGCALCGRICPDMAIEVYQ